MTNHDPGKTERGCGDAWQKGAQQLTTEQRTAFANDPLNLQATDGPTNMQKGDGDAATYGNSDGVACQ